MILMIDNYDSFTYNIVQYLTEITSEPVEVFRNDAITIKEIEQKKPICLVIGPGPGRPVEAGISLQAIDYFKEKMPILGICLGLQAIGEVFGGTIVASSRISHGKVDTIRHDGKGVYRGVPNPSVFTRYNSFILEERTLPNELEVSSRSDVDGEIMGVRHISLPIEGIQFRPESIGSKEGKKILKNFFTYKREPFDPSVLLKALVAKKDLSSNQMNAFMEELTEGNLKENVISGILTALNMKGITADELTAAAGVLRKKMIPIDAGAALLDTCGTGGDGLGTFNISSMAALTAASMGVRVAKHGNRAVSSLSGSADFYAQLGIPASLSPEKAEKMLNETGFAFLFAPIYHSALRFAANSRKDLAIKTIFNLLGPLLNPAKAEYQVVGVFDPVFMEPMAESLVRLGAKKVLVVHGEDGGDEISISEKTVAVEASADSSEVVEFIIDPKQFGLSDYSGEELIGADPKKNVEAAINLFSAGEDSPLCDSVALNGGAALYVTGRVPSIEEGYRSMKTHIQSGKVLELIEKLKQYGEMDNGAC